MKHLQKKTTIHFLSASDRLNYGDLLFPIIFKTILDKAKLPYDFINYGVVKSDLRSFAAMPTKSYYKLLKNLKKRGGKLIIGGGEVFFPSWSLLYSYINPVYNFFIKKRFFSRIERKFNLASLYLNRDRVKEPFCLSKDELPKNVRVYYSSVGGVLKNNLNKKKINQVSKGISSAWKISVRDKRTFNFVKNHSEIVELIPDTAIVMSDLFPKDFLKSRCNLNVTKENYMFFQCAINKSNFEVEKLGNFLQILSEKLDLKVILCPIGLASGHEDDVILKKIRDLNKGFYYHQPSTVYDIMYLIANSSLYLGTSLHGAITAQSYNVPFVGLNPNILKLNAYCTTWFGESHSSLDIDKIEDIVFRYNTWDFTSLKTKVINQKKMVYDNLYDYITD